MLGCIPDVNERLAILARGLEISSLRSWSINVGILFGPDDLLELRDEIIDLISVSLHSSKTKLSRSLLVKNSLNDLFPSYLRFFRISSAIDVK